MKGTHNHSSLDVLPLLNVLTRPRVPRRRLPQGLRGFHTMSQLCKPPLCSRR